MAKIWKTMKWERPVKYAKGVFDQLKGLAHETRWPDVKLRMGAYNHFDWQKVGVDHHEGKPSSTCKRTRLYPKAPPDSPNEARAHGMRTSALE